MAVNSEMIEQVHAQATGVVVAQLRVDGWPQKQLDQLVNLLTHHKNLMLSAAAAGAKCQACDGSGRYHPPTKWAGWEPCKRCGGTGIDTNPATAAQEQP